MNRYRRACVHADMTIDALALGAAWWENYRARVERAAKAAEFAERPVHT
jgi:hypothetical protein